MIKGNKLQSFILHLWVKQRGSVPYRSFCPTIVRSQSNSYRFAQYWCEFLWHLFLSPPARIHLARSIDTQVNHWSNLFSLFSSGIYVPNWSFENFLFSLSNNSIELPQNFLVFLFAYHSATAWLDDIGSSSTVLTFLMN